MDIVWSAGAENDFADIVSDVEEMFGRLISDKVYMGVISHVNLLEKFPRIGVYSEDYSTHEDEVRYLVNTPNYIFYSINLESVYILSILDSRMSPDRISAIIQKRLRQK